MEKGTTELVQSESLDSLIMSLSVASTALSDQWTQGAKLELLTQRKERLVGQTKTVKVASLLPATRDEKLQYWGYSTLT